MKKLMLLLMLMVALSSTAQNKDNPFPKKGYKVKWIKRTPHGFESYTCTIRKFEDSDTIYCMTYSPPDLQPYCVCFSLIHQKGAELIADAMKHRNKSDRIKWIKGYLRYTHACQVDPVNRYNDYWTYFKPKIRERTLTKNFSYPQPSTPTTETGPKMPGGLTPRLSSGYSSIRLQRSSCL